MPGSLQSLDTLRSNGYELDTTPRRLGPLTPSDPHGPMEDLRAQFQSQGYLWLRGLLARESVLAFRARVFARLGQCGLLQPGTDPADGIIAHSRPDGAETAPILREIVRWAAFESFCLAGPMVDFYERFFAEPVYLYKRKLLRYTVPGSPSCTGAHYDLTYLRGAAPEVCTSWIPIGDTPIPMGGLVYLEGSDAIGRKLEQDYQASSSGLSEEDRLKGFHDGMADDGWITKDLPGLAEKADSRWLAADYEAGDVVVHSAYMIHAATMNERTDGVMRLSCDIRYQPAAAQVDARWGRNWAPDDGL